MREHLEVEPAPVERGCRHIIGPAAEQGQDQPADIFATRVAECAGRDRATLWLVLGVIMLELASLIGAVDLQDHVPVGTADGSRRLRGQTKAKTRQALDKRRDFQNRLR